MKCVRMVLGGAAIGLSIMFAFCGGMGAILYAGFGTAYLLGIDVGFGAIFSVLYVGILIGGIIGAIECSKNKAT